MTNRKIILLSLVLAAASLLQGGPASAAEKTGVTLYRLYNRGNGEHFYTSAENERDHLQAVGWTYEGIGWNAPKTSATPVYRLYNPVAGDHLYTTSAPERDRLKTVGWRYEGIGWYSDDARQVPVFRQYNPNAKTGTHNYTVAKAENDGLAAVGWQPEGVAFYGLPSAYDFSGMRDTGALLSLINDKRRSAGLPVLTEDPALTTVAKIRALEIADSFSHVRKDTNDTLSFDTLEENGYTKCTALGEDIAAGQATPEQAVSELSAVSKDYENMVDPAYEAAGLALLYDESAVPEGHSKHYSYYWVIVFAGKK